MRPPEEALRQADCRLVAETAKSSHLSAELDATAQKLRDVQAAYMREQEQHQLALAEKETQVKVPRCHCHSITHSNHKLHS
jgi:hypothetical protein